MRRLIAVVCLLLCPVLARAQSFPPNSGPVVHFTNITGAAIENLQPAWMTEEFFTFAAAAAITVPMATFAGQELRAVVCQNATGGFAPSFTAAAGLTITGTFPTFTTVAGKCGYFDLIYSSPSQAYIVCSQAGPL